MNSDVLSTTVIKPNNNFSFQKLLDDNLLVSISSFSFLFISSLIIFWIGIILLIINSIKNYDDDKQKIKDKNIAIIITSTSAAVFGLVLLLLFLAYYL